MAWSGTLRITDGISILENPQPPTVPNPATLAIAGGSDPLGHATSYFQSNDFNDGDHIRALGTFGTQGETTVIFMTSAQRIEFETATTDDTALTATPTVARRSSRKAGGAKKAAAKKAPAKKAPAKKAATKKAAAKKTGAKKASKSSKQGGAKKAAKSGAGKAPAKRAAKAAKKATASRPAKATAKKSSRKAPAKSTARSAGKKGKKR
jgi:hypothetical protein